MVELIREQGMEIAVDAAGQIRLSGSVEELSADLVGELKQNRQAVIEYLERDQAETFAHLRLVVMADEVFPGGSRPADPELMEWCERMRPLVDGQRMSLIDRYLNRLSPEPADDLPEGWA